MLGLLWFPLTALGSTLLFVFLKLFRRLMWNRKTDVRHLKTWMMALRLLSASNVNIYAYMIYIVLYLYIYRLLLLYIKRFVYIKAL